MTLKQMAEKEWKDKGAAEDPEYLPGNFRSEDVIRLIADGSLPQDGDNFLDIGCGDGNLLLGVNKTADFDKIHGLDIAGNAIQAAKKRVGIKGKSILSPDKHFIVRAHDVDAEGIPYNDELFELVTLTAVLEHFVDPESALEEIFRILKPGGKLFLTTINSQFIGWIYDIIVGHAPFTQIGEEKSKAGLCVSTFTYDDMEKALKLYGFSDVLRIGSGEYADNYPPDFFEYLKAKFAAVFTEENFNLQFLSCRLNLIATK